jgi:transposase, IS30 family
MKKYKHLTSEEREFLSYSLATKMTLTGIAKELGRSPSTLSREITRCGENMRGYRALRADALFQKRKVFAKRPRKIDINSILETYIHTHLKLGWSPEQIAQRLKIEYPHDKSMHISHESIYTYLYVLPRGSLKKELLSYLRQERTMRKQRKHTHEKRGSIPNMISIEERPKDVAERTVPGHWEGDLVVGKDNRSAIGTLVERTTRTTIIVPLREKDAVSVRKAFEKELKKLPKQMKISLTYDRGKEMTEHELFTKKTKIQVYFAHPHSPWERGTNENTNGLIRQYFPKGTDFNTVNKIAIKKVQDLLNGRPRKVLNWRTPFEVFTELLH